MFNKFIVFIVVFFCGGLYADVSMYGGTKSIFAREQNYLILHHHSFYYEKNESRSSISYIELLDLSKAGKTEFKISSPIFTHLFIVKGGGYFIGVSNIKSDDNPQLVLYSIGGKQLKEWSFSCRELTYNEFCAESLYNYIQWFDEKNPQVLIIESSKDIRIKVDENEFFFEL